MPHLNFCLLSENKKYFAMFYHCCREEIYPKLLTPVMVIMHNLKLEPCIVQHQKNHEKTRLKTILIDHQIFFNFVVNSPESVWRIKLNSLSRTCSVKNVSQRKKPHPNRWTPPDAIAHRLACVKKTNSSKNSSRLWSVWGGAKLCLLRKLVRRK